MRGWLILRAYKGGRRAEAMGDAGLREEHPLVGEPCAACRGPLLAGERVALVALGPGPLEADQREWQDGGGVDCPAVAVHAECGGFPRLPAETRRCSICARYVPECECSPGGPLWVVGFDPARSDDR